ncbi:MAG TPA: FAD-dependent oxidoreductase [Pirellulales bacterium]|jgi:2-polyprenyl-6-methoxyphenol hydroxylase-like FAD-dependent oxidoreductase|nr:FAD-dependent oxidoreductase [Pirellulales bacterium]
MPRNPSRVVIVGAGPAGMALAYLLARRGVAVTVLEKHQDFARAFRGEGLQRSGIDAFRQMGLGGLFDRLPHVELQHIQFYSRGRLILRATAEQFGRGDLRAVSQPALLQLLADQAAQNPTFRLEYGVTMRDFLRTQGRVVGVRGTTADGERQFDADLVIGADGRHAATRKQSGFPELNTPQSYDIIWLKVPYTEGYPNRSTALIETGRRRVALAFPTADGGLQIGFVIPKGAYAAMRSANPESWTDDLIGRLPSFLADALRANRETLVNAALLNVVCGRLEEWSAPGFLLIGDAAHPMSPVGGQGVNIALRDALVAANQLCPVLTAGADPAALDAAARRVRDERWPEIVAVQKMQHEQGRLLSAPDRFSMRLMQRLLPLLLRTGLLPWLQRKERRLMSEGCVTVRLEV